MYEIIQETAASLSLLQCFLGLAASGFAILQVDTKTLGPATLMKTILGVIHLAAILALLFFVYAAAINLGS